jgi:hypothetical protein
MGWFREPKERSRESPERPGITNSPPTEFRAALYRYADTLNLSDRIRKRT